MESYKPSKDVIHIVSDERSQNYLYEKNSDKLSRNLEIASIEDVLNMPIEVRREIFAVRDVEEGMVLIKNPIDRRYYLASDASSKLRDSKFDTLTELAKLLGATKVVREIESITEVTRKIDASGNISYKEVEIGISSKKATKDVAYEKYVRVKLFKGCDRNIDYDEAVKLCNSKGLMYDQDVLDMLNNRNPAHANYCIEDDLRVELNSESESMMDTAMSLNVMEKIFKLDAKCKQAITTSTKMRVHWHVEY